MKGYPPTCAQCGSVLFGLATSEELGFPIYFCPPCTEPKAAPPAGEVPEPFAEETVVGEQVLLEAA